jgi:hypothetical protein
MRLQNVQRNDLQRPTVSGLQIHGTGLTRIHGFQPCPGANAPGIPRFETWKVELGGGRDEVVALATSKFQEGIVDHTAHRVGASVAVIGVATTVAIPTRERVIGTRFEFAAKNIEAGVHVGGTMAFANEGLFAAFSKAQPPNESLQWRTVREPLSTP